jgi:hypothetical protein
MFVCARLQVNKSLKSTGDGKGKLVGQALIELKDMCSMAEICETIADFRLKALSVEHFNGLKGAVKRLYDFPGQSITINQARFYIAHEYNYVLQQEIIDESLDIVIFCENVKGGEKRFDFAMTFDDPLRRPRRANHQKNLH